VSPLKKLACALITVGVAAVAVTFHLVVGKNVSLFMLAFYLFGAVIVMFYMGAYTKGRKFTHLPVAEGRVIAIVPTYNDEPELLYNCVWSLIQQSRPPDEIHVVDDGSTNPVEPFDHPLVHWHTKPNGGKRDAQAWVLYRLDRQTTDYLLTVDGDSVLDYHATEHLLRSMSEPKIQAATGLILVRNRAENLLTRLTDLNIGTSCLMIRTSRSVIGAVETTSGALAMYRADVIFDNLDDYVSSGTNGDDRRLTLYALLRGEVVVVNEAIVHSAMPTKVGDMYRQRLRWGKSGWQAIPFSVTNLSGKQLFFPLLSLVQWVVFPIMVLWAILSTVLWGDGLHVLMAFGVYMFIRYGETSLYMITRPGQETWSKLWTWLFLTPLETAVNLGVTRPAKYHALLKLKNRGWETRGNAHAVGGVRRPVWAMRLAYASVVLFASAGAALSIWLVQHESTNPTTPVIIQADGDGNVLDLFRDEPEPKETEATPSPTSTRQAAPEPTRTYYNPGRTPVPTRTTTKPSTRPTTARTTRPTIGVPTLTTTPTPTPTGTTSPPTTTPPTTEPTPTPTETASEPVIDVPDVITPDSVTESPVIESETTTE
jgi:hyaluronan synthase